ncbi:MAG: DUF2892 domain-containing protein [Bacteroidetes bacterium]|nr:DUF2892 domain-containing protein [Bacteroidota bacterium]
MKKNVGNKDRIMRLLIAVFFIILVSAGAIISPESFLVLIVTTVFIVTALLSYCPVYTLFGINTSSGKKDTRRYH